MTKPAPRGTPCCCAAAGLPRLPAQNWIVVTVQNFLQAKEGGNLPHACVCMYVCVYICWDFSLPIFLEALFEQLSGVSRDGSVMWREIVCRSHHLAGSEHLKATPNKTYHCCRKRKRLTQSNKGKKMRGNEEEYRQRQSPPNDENDCSET